MLRHLPRVVFILLACGAVFPSPSNAASAVDLLTTESLYRHAAGTLDRSVWRFPATGTTMTTTLHCHGRGCRLVFNDVHERLFKTWRNHLGEYKEEQFLEVLRHSLVMHLEETTAGQALRLIEVPWSEIDIWWEELRKGLEEKMRSSRALAGVEYEQARMSRHFLKSVEGSSALRKMGALLADFDFEIERLEVAPDMLRFSTEFDEQRWSEIAGEAYLGLMYPGRILVLIKPRINTDNPLE